MRKIFIALAASFLVTVGEAAILKQATANNLQTKPNVFTLTAPGSITVIPPATVYIIGPDGPQTKFEVPAPIVKTPTPPNQISKEEQARLVEEMHFLDTLISQTGDQKMQQTPIQTQATQKVEPSPNVQVNSAEETAASPPTQEVQGLSSIKPIEQPTQATPTNEEQSLVKSVSLPATSEKDSLETNSSHVKKSKKNHESEEKEEDEDSDDSEESESEGEDESEDEDSQESERDSDKEAQDDDDYQQDENKHSKKRHSKKHRSKKHHSKNKKESDDSEEESEDKQVMEESDNEKNEKDEEKDLDEAEDEKKDKENEKKKEKKKDKKKKKKKHSKKHY